MPLKDILHGLHLGKLKPKKELTEVYISISLRYLAFSMISLFVPLYLYDKLGYSLNQTLIFYIVYAVCFGVFTPFTAKIISRIGVKHTILLAVPFYLLFYYLLHILGDYSWLFYSVPVVFALAQTFFWTGFHTEFIKSSDHDHRGREVGKYISLSYLSVLVGPLAGGFLIDRFGFAFVFLIVGVLFFLSAFFLFFTKDFREPSHIKFKHVFSKENLKNSFAFIGYGAQTMAEGVLWPLFIFVILKTYTNLGLLGSAMSAVVALVTYFVGKASDKYGSRNLLYVGGIAYSLTWLVRTLFSSIGFVFGLTMFAGFAYTFIHTPIETMTYNKAEKNPLETVVFREIALNIGRVGVLLLVILTGKFISGFWFSALAGIGYLFF
ncbi:MFS transporter [Candidatus Woesearchaeota archaeon]|nr:MFS transporter [Candidatus Woesearchaeota archaeon]